MKSKSGGNSLRHVQVCSQNAAQCCQPIAKWQRTFGENCRRPMMEFIDGQFLEDALSHLGH